MVDSRRVTVARARPFASRSRAKPSISARRTANKDRDRARHHVVNWRRSSAYASRVRPRYPARNPARATRSASVKTDWIVASAVDGTAVVIGAPPGQAGTGKAGPVPVPAVQRNPNVSRLARARYVGNEQATRPRQAPREILHTAESVLGGAASGARVLACRSSGSGCLGGSVAM